MFKAIWIGIVSAAIALGGLFGGAHKPANPAPAAQATTTVSVTASASGKKVPFADLMKAGGAYKCTVEEHIGGATGTGTIYTADGNTSGSFTASAQGKSYSGYFITAGGYTYSWTSLQPTTGFKMAQVKNVAGGGSTGASYAFNAEQVSNYSCEPWTPDQAKFAPPASVNFMMIGQK